MLSTKTQDIITAQQRFAARVDKETNAQLLSFGNYSVHSFIRKTEIVTIFCCPATLAPHIAGTGWIKQDNPWYIEPILLAFRVHCACAQISRLESQIQSRCPQNIMVDLRNQRFHIIEPFTIRCQNQFLSIFIAVLLKQ